MAYLEAREERLRSLDRAIWEFYPHKRQAFRVSTGLFFLGWIAETREVYVINWYSGREGLQAFSALFHLPPSSPDSLGDQDGGKVLSSRPSAIPASPSRCSGGFRIRPGLEWRGLGWPRTMGLSRSRA
jgi:hypothetical protein